MVRLCQPRPSLWSPAAAPSGQHDRNDRGGYAVAMTA